jgi:3-oxoacyl-[acyl-carrier-protein] synthase-3
MPYAHITGWGTAVPERVMTNHDIAKIVDTSDEWIQERTGIRERRIAGDGETTASLATDAALRALEVANLLPRDVELIICSTSSPEHIFPATACLVQDRLGAPNAGAFDLSAACSGFLFAMNMAAQAIRSGSIKNAVVIGSETLSRIVNWQDRGTCILFGDGAGAFVLQASDVPGGVLSGVMHSDGSGGDLLSLPGGGSKIPTTLESVQAGLHYVQMNGREVYRFATRVMASATREALEAAGLTVQDLQLIIPHQANKRIIEAAARGLDVEMERVVMNIDRYGNTSTASIPIATVEAVQQGRLKQGDKVVFVGFGGGLTWGAMAVEWSGPILPKREVYPRSYQAWVRIRSWLLRLVRRIEGLVWGRSINR